MVQLFTSKLLLINSQVKIKVLHIFLFQKLPKLLMHLKNVIQLINQNLLNHFHQNVIVIMKMQGPHPLHFMALFPLHIVRKYHQVNSIHHLHQIQMNIDHLHLLYSHYQHVHYQILIQVCFISLFYFIFLLLSRCIINTFTCE